MRAVTWHAPGDVRVEEVADPALEAPTDVLLEVSRSAVCGSDLHVYHGDIPGVLPGSVIGHEVSGVVAEVGEGVRGFAGGERVVAPFHVACGDCPPCRRGEWHQCEASAVFGYGVAFGELAGAQAGLLRVPWADVNLRRIPEGVTDEEALFAGDVLSTAFGAVRKARLSPGETVAVIGCGPVGQLVVECALLFGASKVFAVDLYEARAREAGELGAVPVPSAERSPGATVRDGTGGEGADVVVEAVGGSETLELAFELVRDGGRISAVGVSAEESFEFPLMSGLVRDLEFRIGVANVHREIDTVLELLAAGRLDPGRLVSHRLPLEEAPEGYRLFDERKATKVILEVP